MTLSRMSLPSADRAEVIKPWSVQAVDTSWSIVTGADLHKEASTFGGLGWRVVRPSQFVEPIAFRSSTENGACSRNDRATPPLVSTNR